MGNKKIVSILIIMVLVLSSILIIPNNMKVGASGSGGENEGVNLDYIFYGM